MQGNAHCSGRFPEQGYVLGIPAESCDVVAYPLQSHQLIEQSGVARCVGSSKVKKSQRSYAILHGNKDHVFFGYLKENVKLNKTRSLLHELSAQTDCSLFLLQNRKKHKHEEHNAELRQTYKVSLIYLHNNRWR